MSELVVGSIAGLAANSYVVDVATGSTLDLSAGAVFPAGNVIQVVSTTKTDTFSTTSTTLTDVTGLSASITPTSTSNKILVIVSAQIGASASAVTRLSLKRDATSIAGSSTNPDYFYEGDANLGNGLYDMKAIAVHYLDSPSTASAVTYKLQASQSSGTFYLNTRSAGGLYGTSTITLMEIAG